MLRLIPHNIRMLFAACALLLAYSTIYAEVLNCQPEGTYLPRVLVIPAEPGVQIEATFNGIEVEGFSHDVYGLIKKPWNNWAFEIRDAMPKDDLTKLESLDNIHVDFVCGENKKRGNEMQPDQPYSCAIGESMTLEYFSPACAEDNPDPANHPDKKAHFTVVKKRENKQSIPLVEQTQLNVTSTQGVAGKNVYQIPEASGAKIHAETNSGSRCCVLF